MTHSSSLDVYLRTLCLNCLFVLISHLSLSLSPGTCFGHQPACEVSPGLSHYGPFNHPGQGQHNRALAASLPGSAQGRGKGNTDL